MIKMRISKKILAVLLAALMACTMMPFAALAATTTVTSFAELETAVASANAGDTIKLGADIDTTALYPRQTGHYVDLSGLTLDLDGHDIATNNLGIAFKGKDFTIKNGSFTGTQTDTTSYALFIYGTSEGYLGQTEDVCTENVILDGLTINGGVNCWFCENVVLRNCDSTGYNYYAVWADILADVVIESGTYTSNCAKTSGVIGSTAQYGAEYQGKITVTGGNYTVPEGKTLVLDTSTSGPVEITGGTFKNADETAYDVPDKYLAEGVTQDAEGSASQTYRAKIGNNYYATLGDAITAATDGDTITLLDDVTGNFTVPAGKNITIDLDGNTITGPGGNTPAIVNNGTLTVKNGNINNAGLYFPEFLGEGGVAVMNYGVATVKDVSSNTGVLVNRSTVATPSLTIDGGTHKGNPLSIASENGSTTAFESGTIDMFCKCDDTSTMIVDGGTVNGALGEGGSWVINGGDVNSIATTDETISVTVNGGTVNSLTASYGSEVEVNDGTVNSLELNGTSVATISGGEVNGISKGENATVTVTGGTFAEGLDVSGYYDNTQYTERENLDGTVEVVSIDTPAPHAFSLSVEDQIHMNLYVNVFDHITPGNFEYASVKIIHQNPDKQFVQDAVVDEYDAAALEEIEKSADGRDTLGRHKITVISAPAQLMDTVTIEIYERDELKDRVTTSVYDYCKALAKANVSEAYTNLANAMIDYGKAVSDELNYNESAFSDVDYSTSTYADGESLDEVGKVTINDYNKHFKSYAYIATSVPALRVYLSDTVQQVEDDVNMRVLVDDEEVEMKKVKVNPTDEDDRVCIDILNIAPEDLDHIYTVELNNGYTTYATIRLNALAYAKAVKTTKPDLARSMYNYFRAAEAVFGSND